MRHEIVLEVDVTIDVDKYPKENMLYNLEMENKLCRTVLTSSGIWWQSVKNARTKSSNAENTYHH